MELLMEDLGTLGKMLPRIPPPEKKLELLKEDLGISGKSLPRIPPTSGTPHGWLCPGDWRVETNRFITQGYRLVVVDVTIAVSFLWDQKYGVFDTETSKFVERFINLQCISIQIYYLKILISFHQIKKSYYH